MQPLTQKVEKHIARPGKVKTRNKESKNDKKY